MEDAAAGDRFEEAATLRDQVRTLERLETPQKITTTDLEERDLFGAHVEGDRAALQVFSVRDGKVVAREGFLLDRAGRARAVPVASRSSSTTRTGRYVPREVLVPAEVPGPRAARAVADRAPRDASVRIRVPAARREGAAARARGAQRALAFDLEWRHPRKQSQEILRALRDLLDLEVEPRRIECFDISNIQGSDIVASMVCFEDGLPKKSDYRKFRIRGVGGAPDDFASMREVVGRRYKRLLEEGKELPDLVLIDGGKGQLGAAMEALEELGLGDQPVASLAKREELIFVPGRDEPIALPRNSPVLQLVQRVRDEAHRFAVGYPPQGAVAARTLRSELDDIPGVGPDQAPRSCSRASARCAGCAGRARPSWRRRWGRPRPPASAATSIGPPASEWRGPSACAPLASGRAWGSWTA